MHNPIYHGMILMLADKDVPALRVGNNKIFTTESLLEVIDALPLAIAVIDHNVNFVLVNQMIGSFVSKKKYDLIGSVGGNAIGCVHRLDAPKGCGFGTVCLECKLRGTIQRTFKEGRPFSMIGLSMTLEKLGERYLRISTLPLILDREPVVLLAMEDLTEIKRHEREMMEKTKLSAAVKTAGAVCHEINQPLMIILGYVDLLLETQPEDSMEREKLQAIKTQAERLGTITGKLMDITSFKTKKYLNSEIVDLDASSAPEKETGTAAVHE